MGIPYYFYKIVQRNGDILLHYLPAQPKGLFLDFNSIIHCSSAIAVARNKDCTQEMIFEEIVKNTLSIAYTCKPSDLLYIAVDGVAPRAKIQQQRKRRYMSASRTGLINDFKAANNLPVSSWDSNCITPGTQFMQDLDVYLKEYFKANAGAHDFKVVISGHDEPGEGEHKIIQYIKSSTEYEESDAVIYGLDADLIMLSLGCINRNIYLMREMQEDITNFKYVCINTLRGHVSKQAYSMYDYIFLCFFLGNDFLPNVSYLKIRNDGINVLCDIYKKIYERLQQPLVTQTDGSFQVNSMFLAKILEQLAGIESESMKTAIETVDKFEHKPRGKDILEKFTNKLDDYPIIHKFPRHLINPHSDSGWRSKYYHHLFGSASSNMIKESCIKYLEGLVWVTNYYFNNKYDGAWCYPYDYSPCMTDLYKYACSIDTKKMHEQLGSTQGFEVDALHQMLIVLPPQSKGFVPEQYRPLYNSIDLGCAQYFPNRYDSLTFLKTKLWECAPILPYVDVGVLRKGTVKCLKKPF
jgi:5'-3' exonuclease